MNVIDQFLKTITYDNLEWTLILYKINKRGTYNVQTSFCHLDEDGIKKLVIKIINDTQTFFLKDFSETCSYQSGMDAKAKLIKMSINDERVNDCTTVFLKAIAEANLNELSAQGYVLHGKNATDEIYFISKTNPIINSKKKTLLFRANNNEFEIVNKELYSFATIPHIIILNDDLYTSNLTIFEDVFNLTSKIEKSALENKEVIANTPYLPDKFKEYISSIGKTKYRNISNLSITRLNDLENMDIDKAKKYNIIINDGKIIVETIEQMQALEFFLFKKTTFDLADNQLHKVEYFE